MKRTFFRYDLATALLAAVLCSAMAQEPPPQGATILDKYIEATGGRAAYEKLRTEVRTGTMELVGKGITASMTLYRAAPSKSHMVMEMPGVGKMEEGTDGAVVWSRSAIQGPRVKEGDEKALGLLGAAFNGDLRWRELYNNVETVGVEEVSGQPCYKVALSTKDGIQQTRYYDKKTGLVVKTVMTVKTQMGEIPTEALVSDYRSVNGVLVAHKASMKMLGQEIVIAFDSVKANIEIDESHFRVPEEITALLAKDKAK
jgi:hypothetical protein